MDQAADNMAENHWTGEDFFRQIYQKSLSIFGIRYTRCQGLSETEEH